MRLSALPGLAMTAALLASAPLLAAAGPADLIAVHTAQIQNLRVELIDLDLDDGITPAYSFEVDFLALDETASLIARISKGPDGLLPAEPFAFTREDGRTHVATTADSLTVRTAVTLQQALDAVGQNVNPWATIQPWSYLINAQPGSDGPSETTLPRMIVTPNTKVVISGEASHSSMLDPRALAEWLPSSEYAGFTLKEHGLLGAYMEFVPDGGVPGEWIEGDTDIAFFTSMDKTRLSVTEANADPMSFVDAGAFSLTFTNASAASVSTTLAMNVFADPQLEFGLTAPNPVPIPEPATWLTMGLGLGALALAGRRRSRAAS